MKLEDPMERNVALIGVHAALVRVFIWIPVFVLFTRARFDLDGALRLASMYYLFVVVLEVPSGWMSDRFGRVITLRVAAMGFVAAQVCFIAGDQRFAVVALGQFFLAVGFASISGTDVSLHFDTLEALGRANTYQDRQARVASLGFISSAVSALVGGAIGLVDLRLAFVASLGFAIAQLAVSFRLTEPPAAGVQAEVIWRQVIRCLGYLRDRLLGWLFFYGIALVTLEHVAFTVMQPWLTEVLGQSADDLGATPLLSGAIFAGVSFVGAGAARASSPLARRFGIPATLVGFAALSAVIVSAMTLWVHVLVLIIVMFRSAQGAAAPVLISAAVAPKTAPAHRATLLSLNSLAGRLAYGLLILAVSTDVADDTQRVLGLFAIIAWVLVIMVWLTIAVLPAGGLPAAQVGARGDPGPISGHE